MPPMSCTSKWRMPSLRRAASRVAAKASGSRSSSAVPFASRSRNSAVLFLSSSSLSFSNSASSALTAATWRDMARSRRSLRLPKIFLMTLPIIDSYSRIRPNTGFAAWRPHERRESKGPVFTAVEPARQRGLGLIPDVLQGIDDLAVLQDFKVHVRAGRAPAGAHVGDDLALLHHVAHAHQVLLVVRVTRDEAVAMVDLDHVAVAVTRPGIGHHAGGHGNHLRAFGAGEVEAVMAGALAGEGIIADAEIG